MADNYTEFCEVLPNLAPDEEAWLRQQLAEVIVDKEGKVWPAHICDVLSDEHVWVGYRAFLEDPERDEIGSDLTYRFTSTSSAPGQPMQRCLYLSGDQFTAADQAARLVQKFLRRFRPTDHWCLGYADYCSKNRPGEFGGGGMFVTAASIESVHVVAWLEERVQQFTAAKSASHIMAQPTGSPSP